VKRRCSRAPRLEGALRGGARARLARPGCGRCCRRVAGGAECRRTPDRAVARARGWDASRIPLRARAQLAASTKGLSGVRVRSESTVGARAARGEHGQSLDPERRRAPRFERPRRHRAAAAARPRSGTRSPVTSPPPPTPPPPSPPPPPPSPPPTPPPPSSPVHTVHDSRCAIVLLPLLVLEAEHAVPSPHPHLPRHRLHRRHHHPPHRRRRRHHPRAPSTPFTTRGVPSCCCRCSS